MTDYTKGMQGTADAFNRMWIDFATEMAQAGFSFSPDNKPPETAKNMRNAFFKAMSEYCDQAMRSPEFLEGMKESMKHSMAFRKQMNDFFGRVHHEMQGVSRQDLDQMMLALRHVENRVVDSVERIADTLEGICKRVNKVEETLAANNSADDSDETSAEKAFSGNRPKRKPRGGTARRR
jgi:hypothetical protein